MCVPRHACVRGAAGGHSFSLLAAGTRPVEPWLDRLASVVPPLPPPLGAFSGRCLPLGARGWTGFCCPRGSELQRRSSPRPRRAHRAGLALLGWKRRGQQVLRPRGHGCPLGDPGRGQRQPSTEARVARSSRDFGVGAGARTPGELLT